MTGKTDVQLNQAVKKHMQQCELIIELPNKTFSHTTSIYLEIIFEVFWKNGWPWVLGKNTKKPMVGMHCCDTAVQSCQAVKINVAKR